jgi:hypothetical protein
MGSWLRYCLRRRHRSLLAVIAHDAPSVRILNVAVFRPFGTAFGNATVNSSLT